MSAAMKGISVVRLHYTADPEKAEVAWAEQQKTGYSEDRWQREMEMNAQAGSTSAIFRKEYRPKDHERVLTPNPTWPMLHAWDFGKGCPAHLWFQRTLLGGVRVYGSIFGQTINLRPFAAMCVGFEVNTWGDVYPNRRDFCDVAGTQDKDDGLKSVEVLRDLGLRPRFRKVGVEEAITEISRLLTTVQLDGEPNFLIDPRHNQHLILALSSEYKRGPQGDPERTHPFIDLIDALRYGILNTSPRLEKRETRPIDFRRINPVSGYGPWGTLGALPPPEPDQFSAESSPRP